MSKPRAVIIEESIKHIIGAKTNGYSMRHPLFRVYLALEFILDNFLELSNVATVMRQVLLEHLPPDQIRYLTLNDSIKHKYIKRILNEPVFYDSNYIDDIRESLRRSKTKFYKAGKIFCDLLTELGYEEISVAYYIAVKRDVQNL